MTKQLKSSYRIKNFDVSGREIGVFIAFTVIIGIVILAVSWKYMGGGELFSSSINVVESTQNGQENLTNITNVSVSNVTATSATISWQINDSSPIRLDYGFNQNQLTSQISLPPSTTSTTLTSLFPHVKYFFRLTANPGAPTSISTTTYSFITAL